MQVQTYTYYTHIYTYMSTGPIRGHLAARFVCTSLRTVQVASWTCDDFATTCDNFATTLRRLWQNNSN